MSVNTSYVSDDVRMTFCFLTAQIADTNAGLSRNPLLDWLNLHQVVLMETYVVLRRKKSLSFWTGPSQLDAQSLYAYILIQ